MNDKILIELGVASQSTRGIPGFHDETIGSTTYSKTGWPPWFPASPVAGRRWSDVTQPRMAQ